MTDKLRGTIIPAVVPFDDADGIDVDAFAYNVERWSRTDVAGYMVLGSNGEFRMLDDAESVRVVELAAELAGNKTLIVGVGRESLHHTRAFLDLLEPWYRRIDYVSVLTPSYFPKLMDAAALRDYYTTIADHSPVPVLLYIAPGFANGVSIPPALLAELADHPNIHGAKDTSTNLMVDYQLAAGGRDDFALLAGSLNNIMADLSFGGPGGVVSAANYFPGECARLTTMYHDGDHEGAYAYYVRLQRLVKASGAKYGIVGVKACMDAVGLRGGRPRRPVRPLDPETVAEIRRIIERDLPALAE